MPMPDTRFTEEGVTGVMDAVEDIFKALSKAKQGMYISHLNEILLFLEEARGIAAKMWKK